jgi:hypothetical protein
MISGDLFLVTNLNRTVPIKIKFDVLSDDKSSVAISSIETAEDLQEDEGVDEFAIPSKLVVNDAGGTTVYAVKRIACDVFSQAWVKRNVDRTIGSEEHPIGKLIIEEGITTIEAGAFYSIYANTVVWPSSSPIVRRETFHGASIKAFQNLDNVKEVQSGAFCENTVLTSFDWPKSCNKIPESCFVGDSNLTKVNILNDTIQIENYAFEETAMTELDLSNTLKYDINETNLESYSSIQIKKPYYI